MRILLAAVSVLFASPVIAQDAVTSAQFDSYVARDAAFGDVAWHVDNVNAAQKGPLIVWLPGSGAYPISRVSAMAVEGRAFLVNCWLSVVAPISC